MSVTLASPLNERLMALHAELETMPERLYGMVPLLDGAKADTSFAIGAVFGAVLKAQALLKRDAEA